MICRSFSQVFCYLDINYVSFSLWMIAIMRCRWFSTLRLLLRFFAFFSGRCRGLLSLCFLVVWGVHFVLRLRLSGVSVSMALCV